MARKHSCMSDCRGLRSAISPVFGHVAYGLLKRFAFRPKLEAAGCKNMTGCDMCLFNQQMHRIRFATGLVLDLAFPIISISG